MLFIDTETCMVTGGPVRIQGTVSNKSDMIGCETLDYKICTLEFAGSLNLGKNSTMMISGENALRIVSQNGDIVVSTKLKMDGGGTGVTAKQKWLGGFFNYLDRYTGQFVKSFSFMCFVIHGSYVLDGILFSVNIKRIKTQKFVTFCCAIQSRDRHKVIWSPLWMNPSEGENLYCCLGEISKD